jgi:Gram-negative bacterial TonB protein C-terminal
MKTVIAAVLLCALPLIASEDPKLRQEAEELAQRSLAISENPKWPAHRRVVQFRYTDSEAVTTEGTASMDYEAPHTRRSEVSFGNYHSLHIEGPGVAGGQRTELVPPPGVREMQHVTPSYTIRFDHEDIINDIRDATVQARAARCITFTTNFGATSKDGEVCYDRGQGMLLHFQFGGKVLDNSNWTRVGAAWIPAHIEETEDGRHLITIDQTITLIDSFPPDTFTLPSGVPPYQWCTDWRRPTGLHMPQPPAGPGDNVDDIAVQGRIERDGTLTNLAIRDSKRPDLNAEALAVAAKWTFRAATCDGKAASSSADFVLHFKGR